MGRRPVGRRPSARKPAFVKILVEDFTKKLLIPLKFVRLHRRTLARKCLLRCTGTQDAWRVRTKQINDSLYFKKGWKKLAQHHSLGFGDLLVFWYAQDCEFYVDIFDKSCCFKEPVTSGNIESRRDTTPILPSQEKKANFETPVLKAAEEFMASSKFPTFKRIMRSAYVRVNGFMPVKSDFAEVHLKDSTREVKIEVSGHTWTVRVQKACGAYRLTKCWGYLAMEHILKVGDVCIFELINTEDYTLKLSIFSSTSVGKNGKWQIKGRTGKALDAHSSQAIKGSRRHSTHTLRDHRKEASSRTQALDEAEELMSSSEFPAFLKIMQWAYVRHNGYMPLKTDFARMHFKDSAREVKIEVSGMTWTAGLLKDRNTYRLTRCWNDLAMEHALKVGDRVPLSFVKQMNATEGAKKVKLQCRGKEWDAVINIHGFSAKIIHGWLSFAEQNSLYVGDACVLELISKEDALIRVTVFKCTYKESYAQ